MAYRVGHEPLGANGAAWLIALADPAAHSYANLPRVSGTILPRIALAGFAHGVLPALRRNLRLAAIERGPSALVDDPAPEQRIAETIADVDSRLVPLSGQALLLAHHARRIAAELERAKLPGAIIKGLVYAERLYARPSERSFTDVDILAAPAAVDAISAILERQGFVRAIERNMDDHAEYKWVLPSSDLLLVEVQTDLVHSPRQRAGLGFGYDDLLAAGGGNPTDATALLAVAAVHGAAGHQFERLQPAVDVLLGVRGAAGPIDRDRLIAVGRTTGTTAALQAAFDIVGRIFREPAALALADALGPTPWRSLRRALITPGVVARAQTPAAYWESWRRLLLRDLIRRSGQRSRA